ncbi:MAG: AAA family ATPase [Candidatus Competibacteraceae bacterium]|nr:AAA family ATPase [Candidatus Competibacteraceae bacterium]
MSPRWPASSNCVFQRPLASAGLFAICGPTGAGKSTLLDALCLALYNNTPRLAKASARGVNLPDVGAETVTPREPGNLLRRGAGEGYAEVDFIGNDGIDYRARWAVRRARGKTTGKLQNVEMSLQRLSDARPSAAVAAKSNGKSNNGWGCRSSSSLAPCCWRKTNSPPF